MDLKISDQSFAGQPVARGAEDLKLKNACREFETILLKQMLEVMQSSTSMFGKGFGGDFFQGMFQDEIAKEMAEKGMGVSDLLYSRLTKSNVVK